MYQRVESRHITIVTELYTVAIAPANQYLVSQQIQIAVFRTVGMTAGPLQTGHLIMCIVQFSV